MFCYHRGCCLVLDFKINCPCLWRYDAPLSLCPASATCSYHITLLHLVNYWASFPRLFQSALQPSICSLLNETKLIEPICETVHRVTSSHCQQNNFVSRGQGILFLWICSFKIGLENRKMAAQVRSYKKQQLLLVRNLRSKVVCQYRSRYLIRMCHVLQVRFLLRNTLAYQSYRVYTFYQMFHHI